MIPDLYAFMTQEASARKLAGNSVRKVCSVSKHHLEAPPICLSPGVFTGQTGIRKSASRLFTAKHNETSLWPQDTLIQFDFLSSVKANNSPISSAAMWCRREYLPPEEPWNHVMCVAYSRLSSLQLTEPRQCWLSQTEWHPVLTVVCAQMWLRQVSRRVMKFAHRGCSYILYLKAACNLSREHCEELRPRRWKTPDRWHKVIVKRE